MVISVRQNKYFLSQPFLMISNFYLAEVLRKLYSLTIVTSKKILKMSNYVLILSIFFLITRTRNCSVLCKNYSLKCKGEYQGIFGTKYSRMDQVKFVEDSP